MSKHILKMLTFIISILFLTKNVYAECSYQERKDLLNAAENVKINMETIDNGNYSYSYVFHVTGITEDLFITYYNTNDGEENYISYKSSNNGAYSFTDNETYGVYTYEFEISSIKKECYGNSLTKKRIKKPMFNIYSENVNCKKTEYSDFKYCKKFLEEDYHLTEDKFYETLFNYVSKMEIEDIDDIKEESFIKKNLLILIIIPTVVIIGIVIFIIVRKKKNEL